MKFTVSLKKNREFRLVYNRGKSIANRLLVMYIFKPKKDSHTAAEENKPENRLGVTVSKKVGKAVVRNKVRRRIKESYRLVEPRVPRSFYIVIIARAGAKDASFKEIDSALKHLLRKHELI